MVWQGLGGAEGKIQASCGAEDPVHTWRVGRQLRSTVELSIASRGSSLWR